MKRLLIGFLIGVAGVLVLGATTSATGDDGWACPAGTVHTYKVEPLTGQTFTVPTPPQGWTITAVILKVGGPGGGSHIDFTPVTPGQILDVSNQKYDISHAHICKGQVQETTTSTSTSTSTTSTTSTTTSTSVPSGPTTTSTTSTILASTTTVPESTSTSSPSTSSPSTTSSVPGGTITTTSTAPVSTTTTTGEPSVTTTMPGPLMSSTLPATVSSLARRLPSTGAGDLMVAWAALLLAVGGSCVLATRRR